VVEEYLKGGDKREGQSLLHNNLYLGMGGRKGRRKISKNPARSLHSEKFIM
jgi:hypothetical protein